MEELEMYRKMTGSMPYDSVSSNRVRSKSAPAPVTYDDTEKTRTRRRRSRRSRPAYVSSFALMEVEIRRRNARERNLSTKRMLCISRSPETWDAPERLLCFPLGARPRPRVLSAPEAMIQSTPRRSSRRRSRARRATRRSRSRRTRSRSVRNSRSRTRSRSRRTPRKKRVS